MAVYVLVVLGRNEPLPVAALIAALSFSHSSEGSSGGSAAHSHVARPSPTTCG